ncbi:MAG: hypothetical protein QOH12_2150 [Solirubrobacteraceae bacterium]|jgi:hypothetical protein|nr:hypothetical protein [Solirubrobacteraceae bacterium]
MSGWPSLEFEPSVAASPIWIRLRDAFTGRMPAGPISVSLERRVGSDWLAFAHRHQISSTGDLAFLNLGRTRDPGAVGSFDVRITVLSRGTIAEAPDGSAAITATVTAWAPGAPAVAPLPTELRLFPSPSYAFPAGTPLLAGRVVDVHGNAIPRARIWAAVTVQNRLLTEEVRSDGDGRFRLPLRWSVGATDIKATLGAQAGSITVSVPGDLSSTHQITLT